MAKLKLTLVTPVFNEAEVIGHFYLRARDVLDSLPDVDARIVFVVDRSTDNTLDILREIVERDARAEVLALSSRFGHQMSLLAGIKHAKAADCIVMMDSDLQHPPELIPQLLAEFRAGADVVYTIRKDTQDVGLARKLLGNLYYKLINSISNVPINANAADFRLISRRVADTLRDDFQECNLFLRGLFPWIGFTQAKVEFVAEKRFAGNSKYSASRMLQLAFSGILSFSAKPLYLGIYVGLAFAALAFLQVLYFIGAYFVDRTIPSGWTTLAVMLLLFSGVQLIVFGVMGAYIGGIYMEVKRRPRYIIEEVISNADKSS